MNPTTIWVVIAVLALLAVTVAVVGVIYSLAGSDLARRQAAAGVSDDDDFTRSADEAIAVISATLDRIDTEEGTP